MYVFMYVCMYACTHSRTLVYLTKLAHFEKLKLTLIGWESESRSWDGTCSGVKEPSYSAKVTQRESNFTISSQLVVMFQSVHKSEAIMERKGGDHLGFDSN